MANLNLSEFTEKLFVADADHTFIWDSAALISKRVSRNSWLNSGTLTSDAPVTISQTWGTTGIYTAAKVNVTETATANSASRLFDAQIGGVSKFSVNKGGGIVSKANIITANGDAGAAGLSLEMVFANYGLGIDANGNTAFLVNGTAKSRAGFGVAIASDQSLSFTNTTHVGINATPDTILVRDSASGNTLALRNGAAAQTFRIYNTTDTGVTTYERAALGFSSNVFRIGTENLAGVTAPRDICLNSGTGTTQIAGSGGNSMLTFPVSLGGTNTGKIGYFGGAFEVGSIIAAPLRLITSNLTRVTVSDAGNVGIGTTAPGAKLEVVGAAGDLLLVKNAAQSVFKVNSGGGSGSVEINQSNSPSFVINQSTGNRVTFGVGSNNLQAFNASSVPMDFNIQGSGGNVGIGTTSPTSKLQVSAGDVEVDTIAKGVILKSPDGTRYRVTVANGGTLSVAAV